MKERAGIQSVEVGFALLAVLAKSEGALMLRDLASAAGMSAAKAHRYLVSFQRLNLVHQDHASTRYDLGPAALQLGLAALTRLDPVKLARERMAPLMAKIGHTVALAVWGNQGPTIVHWQESPHAMTVLRLGDVMPLLTSATGRCFAAYMPRDLTGPMLKAELARAQKMKRHDVPLTQADAKAMLDEVRERGLARVVDALLPGVAGFSAPVFDSDGHLALAMVSLGPTSSFDASWDGAPAKALRHAAQQLSAELGQVTAGA
ncbi:IclR family transcriptional regulator [Limnohabitans sp. JirII-29]|uniref:IclR family transcriptional regulator n=1 Tax=unclassified Limnohabitans TaxID=2626134 RepID=UPI000C1F8E03|nr:MULTISPECIES: IclR family transcriptional regulator [unclassified Limnohabitans]PIT74638.1 IclR family transcriptional regulator [Limnohabitans sp. JirII-31]PUE29037.1 IclR family transcriptional regulator [Limnohabitans sp. JirII-29]